MVHLVWLCKADWVCCLCCAATYFLSTKGEEVMQPFDVAVVTGGGEVYSHQVWAASESEAECAISIFYKHTTLVGIVFASDDKESN